jgi:arylesterase/paraoxonase
MFSNNGIARAGNDTFYVVGAAGGKLNILERQADDTLVLTDVISTGKSKEGCFVVL